MDARDTQRNASVLLADASQGFAQHNAGAGPTHAPPGARMQPPRPAAPAAARARTGLRAARRIAAHDGRAAPVAPRGLARRQEGERQPLRQLHCQLPAAARAAPPD